MDTLLEETRRQWLEEVGQPVTPPRRLRGVGAEPRNPSFHWLDHPGLGMGESPWLDHPGLGVGESLEPAELGTPTASPTTSPTG